jgi:hypothetical protein
MTPIQCATCRHYRKVGRCKAYPDGIPEELLTGAVQHDKPYKGDNGIRFEPIKKPE